MNLLTIFSDKAPNKVFISVVLGALAGIFYAGLIPLVLSGVQLEDKTFKNRETVIDTFLSFEVANYQLAVLFFVSCLLILTMRSVSQIILVRVATLVGKDLRMQFYQRVSQAPLSGIEKIGSSKLLTSIYIDIPRIISGASALPTILINGITVLGMLSFLMYLNYDVFKLVILAIVIGIICFQFPMMLGQKMFMRSRETRDKLQDSIKGLIHGAKELKLDSIKRQHYLSDILLDHENKIFKHEKNAHTIVISINSFGDLISFFVVGVVCFIFVNYYPISSQELIGVVMALLYVTGPISILLDTIPQLVMASISYKKYRKLLTEIPNEEYVSEVAQLPSWSSFAFNDVEYAYSDPDDEPSFKIGPINLEIKKGEVTFIVGANGSGKSTLSKLITLHYRPTSGNITYGNQEISASNILNYRQNIGAIYSDYFLFDRLLITLNDDLLAMADHYLKVLNLDKKVKIVDGQFSTLALSDGQRKRLALLVMLLENKEIYLFDEWAADQDPIFKDVFYNEILPSLKSKNKAIIVISHDDRYFDIADQLLVMEQGTLTVKIKSTALKSELIA